LMIGAISSQDNARTTQGTACGKRGLSHAPDALGRSGGRLGQANGLGFKAASSRKS
jgi:hypothetical protein